MGFAKRMIIVLVCFLSLVGCIFSSSSGMEIVKGELGAKIDEYLTRITPYGFSGAALVAKDGEVILNKGYGMAIRSESRAIALVMTVRPRFAPRWRAR